MEWDAKIPPFPVMHEEVLKAKQFMSEHLEPAASKNLLTPAPGPAASRAGTASQEGSSTVASLGRKTDASWVPHPLHHVRPEVV